MAADHVRFTLHCYPAKVVAYNHSDHPRHAFPEDWDSGLHPRFDFENLQSSIKRLIAKGYTLHMDSAGLKLRDRHGTIMFEMAVA